MHTVHIQANSITKTKQQHKSTQNGSLRDKLKIVPSSSFISELSSISFPAQCTFWQSSNSGDNCKGGCLFLGTLPFFKNVAQPQITWDLKYLPGLETFPFWMEIHSMEAWSLTKTKTPSYFHELAQGSLHLWLWAFLTVQYPLQSVSLSQDIQPLSPNSKASKCQAAAISIRFNDLQEPPENRLEVNASLMPLKRSDPTLQRFQVLSSMGSMLKKSAWPPVLLRPCMPVQHGTWWAQSRTTETIFLLQGYDVWKPW